MSRSLQQTIIQHLNLFEEVTCAQWMTSTDIRIMKDSEVCRSNHALTSIFCQNIPNDATSMAMKFQTVKCMISRSDDFKGHLNQ